MTKFVRKERELPHKVCTF